MEKTITIENLPYNRRLFNKPIFFGINFIEHKIKPPSSYYTFIVKNETIEIINNIKHVKITSTNNDTIYTVKNKVHREDSLPAIIYNNVGCFWFKNGLPHRDFDLPACIYNNNTKEWYFLGKIHRVNKPAATFDNTNDEEWFLGGQYHRDLDLPAKIYTFEKNYVLKKWYIHGDKKRTSNQPVLIIENSDYFEWYLDNSLCTKKDFEKQWLINNIKYFN